MERRRLALAALLCGFAVIVVSQRLAPIAGPPLYDGVVVEDPYKWLSPPPGYEGGAQSASASGAVQGGQSPNLGVGTQEQPPQAQVFAGQGYLVMPPGTTTINVSIHPVAPVAQPSDGVIAGNVYRFSLTNQNGAPLIGEASGGVTVVLRGPPNLPSAQIERLAGTTWTPLQTDPAGTPHVFTAVVTDFGDFAIVAPPGWTPAPPGQAQANAAGPALPGSTATAPTIDSTSGSIGSTTPLALIVVGAALLFAILALSGFALARRKKPAAAAPPTASRRPRPSTHATRRRPPRRQ
jgi:hypothetical protein